MKKKVLIDGSTLTSQVDGLSIYIINLILHIPANAFKIFDFDILVNPGFTRPDFDALIGSGKFGIVIEKIAPIGPKRDWHMFWFLRKNKKKYDIIHITSNQYPMSLKNGISTIHDITFKKYFDNPKFSFNSATWYMDKVIKICLKRAGKIIAVSTSTKNELIHQYHLNTITSEKISVSYEGWEHLKGINYEPCRQYAELSGYLFYVGTARKHKNIQNLLKAFRTVLEEFSIDTKLVLAGSDKHLQPDERKLIDEINQKGERVIVTGYLSNACVWDLFRRSDAFVFPSLSEGFGLPLLEAFYHNVPVICSNTTSLPEVAGDAAIYFDPVSADDIAEKIAYFYQKPEMRNSLVVAGKKRLEEFSWNSVAQRTIDTYKQFLNLQD